MKTDSIFYRLFQEIPSIFFELIGNSPQLAELYQFSSVEVKQTALRIDGVFLPDQNTDNPIYFLEVQFQLDTDLYHRLFSEIFLYIRQNKPKNNWNAVVIYPTRSIDTQDIQHYQEFFTSQRVRVIYLDELAETTSLPIGIATIKLIIANPDNSITQARELITRTKQEIDSQLQQQQVLQIIETILIYKFPRMNREEIEAMFGLSELKQTRFYQEAKEEGIEEGEHKAKLDAVPGLIGLGLTREQIAQVLNLSLAEISEIIQQQNINTKDK
ncbi:MAG: Rpn family recombination-promoting nuclease/putative transposase [Dolichospermum sp. UKL201]|jgi:predicted transposase/invertase (TIGR01784 family)|nr:MAG: flagellar assembly protein H [Anabaena sp. MDT14b]QSV53711.1 MAG: Rpn family recombination-promoting nuclease/putative transposase [Dolichospermum sp. UKL201]